VQIFSGVGFLVRVIVVSAVVGFVLGLYVSQRLQTEAEPGRETTSGLTLQRLDASPSGVPMLRRG
jgi:ABC-type uncharacterized transport system permease subunit